MAGQGMNEWQRQQLLCLYYDNFHNAHPILPPFPAFQKLRGLYIPENVLTMMRYIGAHYLPDKTAQMLLAPVALGIGHLPLNSTQDPFLLQCLLLLAIVEHADTGDGVKLFRNAAQFAHNLGINTDRFAQANSHGWPELEAMWARTYWELCIVDVLINAPSFAKGDRLPMFRTLHRADFPKDEELFSEIELLHPGHCLYVTTPEDILGKHMFKHGFSSQIYRIRAAVLLACVFCLPQAGDYERHACAIGKMLSDFKACLRPHRVNSTLGGRTHWEEMVFQAQAMASMASIYLLQPHSGLEQPLISRPESFRLASILYNFCFQEGNPAHIHTTAVTNGAILLEIRHRAEELIGLLYSEGLLHHAARHGPLVAVHGAVAAFLVLAAGDFQQSTDFGPSAYVSKTNVLQVLGALSKAWPLAGSMRVELAQLMRLPGAGCRVF